VVGKKLPTQKDHTAFVVRDQQSNPIGLLDPEDEAIMIPRNVGNWQSNVHQHIPDNKDL